MGRGFRHRPRDRFLATFLCEKCRVVKPLEERASVRMAFVRHPRPGKDVLRSTMIGVCLQCHAELAGSIAADTEKRPQAVVGAVKRLVEEVRAGRSDP